MTSVAKICSIEDCNRKVASWGWCATHYTRWRKHGNTDYLAFPRDAHGLSHHPLYKLWTGVKYRVLNPRVHNYPRYGGRGIQICDRWKVSFPSFLNDVGEKPDQSMSLDRKDNEGHYSCGICSQCKENKWPMNVRWATPTQQAINTRIHKTNNTGYRGVYKKRNKFIASISVNNRTVRIGTFITAEDAALAYNDAAIKYRGKDAKLNTL